ncbi:MAG: TRAP transporter substrate-binding protein [Alphaproteobacteria bacterium]|nr:TRAP transporter substrate-binding protein [Alphaproteobacteria bacterium]
MLAGGTAAVGLAAGGVSAQSTRTLTLASVNAVGTLVNRLGNHYRDDVAKTNAGVRINHVEGEVLGNAPQVMDQVSRGSLHLMATDSAWIAPFHKDLQVMNWSFAFKDIEHYRRYLKSDLFLATAEEVAKTRNVRVIGAAPGQPRYLYARVPVRDANGLKGLKIRVPQIRTFVESWKSFGTAPTPLNFGEVFLGIRTGVIDGAFGAPSDTFGNNFHVSGNHVVKLEDTFSSYMLVINEAAYQSLSPAQRTSVAKTAAEACEWASKEATAELDSLIAKMGQSGATFSTIDTAALRMAAADAGRKLESEGEWSAGLLQKLQAL